MKNKENAWTLPILWLGETALMGVALWMALSGEGASLEQYVGLAVIALLLLVAGLWYWYSRVSRPLEELEELLDRWPATQPEALREKALSIRGMPQGAARMALTRMEGMEEKLAGIRQVTAEQTAAETKGRLAAEICRFALPQRLENSPALEYFGIEGLKDGHDGMSSTFYDYFFLDAGLLAVAIGRVPGAAVSNALFMVVAQTTIRSRLRLGRSLEQTMADVNTQLYDLGARQAVHVLVGLLRTSDGRFTYVNAGGMRPLMMKNEERYECLETPVYAPLGINEKVSYRAMELRLRQGDRLFFYTDGLESACNKEGTPFREQLRAVLNRSRSQAATLADILRFVADEAAVYCQRDEDLPGYVSMVLEYRKGNKELAHSEVPAVPEAAQTVAKFLKKQFEDNGIPPRRYAKVAVMVDEMFALCCRRAVRGTTLITECGAAPDGESVTIRMTGVLNGVNPIQDAQGDTESSAVEFIRSQVDYITFKPGPQRDTLVVVCFWE